jgi:hypothetical protein
VDEELRIVWGDVLAEGTGWIRYLGKEWRCSGGVYAVRVPRSYWEQLLDEMGMTSCRLAATPSDPNDKVIEDSPRLGDADHATFRRVVGKAMYGCSVRPDMSYTVKELARRLASPTVNDWQRMHRLLRYIRGTMNTILELNPGERHGEHGERDEGVLRVYADADWATGPSRRSTTGGAIFWNGVLLTCWSRTQPVVALSTAESELLAMTTGVQEGQFARHLLDELGVKAAVTVYSDSSAARAVVTRRGVGRMKHLAVRDLWLQDQLRDGQISVKCVGSEINPADLFTKSFAGPRFRVLTKLIGMRDDEAPKQTEL